MAFYDKHATEAELKQEISGVRAFVELKAGELRNQIAGAKADQAIVQSLASRLNELRTQMDALVLAIGRAAGMEVEKAVQEFEDRIELASRKNLKRVRDDLDSLRSRFNELSERPCKPLLPPPYGAPDQLQTDIAGQIEKMEIGLRKVELKTREAENKIGQLERQVASASPDESLGKQMEGLLAERDRRAANSSSFWQRLRWLLLGNSSHSGVTVRNSGKSETE